MVRRLITDKRLADKRFRRTEEAILQAFFALRGDVGMIRIAKNAGVARSTVYIHHRATREIIPDYEKYILKKYQKVVQRMLTAKNSRFEAILMRTLIFMVINKQIFRIVLRGRSNAIGKMIDKLEIKTVNVMGVSKNQRHIFKIYRSEVIVLIEEWCERGFNGDEMNKLVENIVYLTKTAKMRLGVLK